MKKYSPISILKLNFVYLFILIFLFLSGCAGILPTVPDERKIPLAHEDTIKGDFKYGPLDVEYSYSLTGNNLSLAGKITYRDNFGSLDVRVMFLDLTGAVLQRHFIYSSGYRPESGRNFEDDFQKTFIVPAGSVAMTFTSSTQERRGHR